MPPDPPSGAAPTSLAPLNEITSYAYGSIFIASKYQRFSREVYPQIPLAVSVLPNLTAPSLIAMRP